MKKIKRKKPPILDDLDQTIIHELQKNARQSYNKIGKKVGASEGTVRNRIRQALHIEIIQLKAVLNPPKVGLEFSCVMGLTIAIDKLAEAESMLVTSPNVYYLSGCTGTFDLIAILFFRNTNEFDTFVRGKISKLPGIKSIQTFVNMRTIKKPWINDLEIMDI